MTRTPSRSLAVFVFLVPVVLYAALAGRMITARVGYEMDEALYVESAVYMLHGSGEPPFAFERAAWITLGGRFIPLMIIPYVGATKAYLALPLFVAFGGGPEVARISGVLLGAIGIAGLVALVGAVAGAAPALLTGAFLAIHPSYLDLTVFDNGGASVWMGASGIAALALVRLLRRPSRASAFLLGLASGLGVWARLNVLWLLGSCAFAALVVFGRRALPRKEHVSSIAAGGILGSLPFLLYSLRSRATLQYVASARRPLTGELVSDRLRALAELMVSDGEQRFIWWGPPLPRWQVAVGGVLLAATLLAAAIPGLSREGLSSRWRRFFAVSATVLALILVTSRLNVSQHHLVAVLPLAAAALSMLAYEIVRRFQLRMLPVLGSVGAGLAALLLSWDLRIDRELRRTGGRGTFSSALDDVAVYLAAHPLAPDRLKILDWGFQNSLYVVSGGAVYGTELFWGASREASRRGWTWDEELRDGGSFLMFASRGGPPSLTAAGEGFDAAMSSRRLPRSQRVFRDRTGAPVAVLVEVAPNVAP